MKEKEIKKDIFISYKNDDIGNLFAGKLSDKLKKFGYEVYYNPDEQHSGEFPERLRKAVNNCTDFILVLTSACLEQLLKHDKVDWIREELLTAKNNNKNIIPLIMPGVVMPKDRDDMPEDLNFLPGLDGVKIYNPDFFDRSPLEILTKNWIRSQPEKADIYKDVFNSNTDYDVNDDFKKMLELSQSGDTKAMYALANMYFYGFADENGNSSRDFSKAFKWFKKITETENDYTELANCMIAKMYYRGIVPREKQSYTKAFEYYRRALNGSEYAKQQYAFMLSVGMGCDYDYQEAEKQYLIALENGDNMAVNGLANLYMQYGEFQKAANLYRNVLGSFPKAAYKLGCLYMQGVLSSDKKPDYFKAATYFQLAIQKGYCDADVYYQLGLVYFRGTSGFIIDYKIAQENFKIASDMGYMNAQYMLGYMYEFGLNELDLEKAIYYHTLAADCGHPLSPIHLASLYQLPEYKNYHKAFKYAKMAADTGGKEGEFIYGNLLFFGRGCQADNDKAYEMYTRSYQHGFEQAKFMMEKIDELSNRNI